MDWGDKAQWFEDISQEEGAPIPSAILDKPTLREDLVIPWECFHVLNETRQYGFGIAQPILFSEIKAYIELYNLTHDIEGLIEYVKYLDGIYLARMNKVKKQ